MKFTRKNIINLKGGEMKVSNIKWGGEGGGLPQVVKQ